MASYKMRASFSFRSKKAKICMPKITRPETKALTNETRVCPCVFCAAPGVGIEVLEELLDVAAEVRVAVAEVIADAREVMVLLREVDMMLAVSRTAVIVKSHRMDGG